MRAPCQMEEIRNLGKYTLLEKLGEGCLGPVYRGFDQDLGRAVAVRIVSDAVRWDPEVEARFHRECQSVAGLQHPNIAAIFEVGKEGPSRYIVMESLGSATLKSLIAGKPAMAVEEKLSIMIQVADGLSHAHKNDILHYDLRPGKIHVTAGGGAKIQIGRAHV